MTVDPITKEVTKITVSNQSTTTAPRIFDVVKLLHSSPILYGRGTRVWIVKDEHGAYHVLKDSWILASNVSSEIQFIQKIQKIIQDNESDGHFFKYSCPSYLTGDECVCSTDTIRHNVPEKAPTRNQRRLVMPVIGDPVTSFRSKKEFVSTFLDIVNVLDFLNSKARVIHGDISINNILIRRIWDHGPNDSPSQLLVQPSVPVASATPQAANTIVDEEGTTEPIESSGMLIDCDFMRDVEQDTHQTSGTLPFMAIKALRPTPEQMFRHHAGHDLECLMYTMLTICMYTTGPGELRKPEKVDNNKDFNFNSWFHTADRQALASLKWLTLSVPNLFIKPFIPKYWEDFVPFLMELIDATWEKDKNYLENPNIATHQAYRDILKRALAKYTEEEDDKLLAPYAAIPPKLPEKRPSEDNQPSQRSKRLRLNTSTTVPRNPILQSLSSVNGLADN
ncbi:hypothetical protein BDN70DRAFT_821141 [Pholiota conissans]|uniref:Fungal-type protein kinase domain-containing protein n=1 Tax=Pholiota conissans TaxID=109636 RepID=A0A9P6CLF5_9AGAR|nr:hypothetical protein BDN70DRAFT_821141 [Pholiota conissans]